MKSIIKRIVIFGLSLVFSAVGYISYYTYKNKAESGANLTSYVEKVFNQDRTQVVAENVKIDVYSRQSGDKYNSPVFAVGDLINKSIDYKKLHPEEDVSINFAIYRMEIDTACYYKKGSRNYGKMTSLDTEYTDDCERVTYSMVKAAKNGINVKFIYHRDVTKHTAALKDYMDTFSDEPCFFDETKKVSDFLEVKHVKWDIDNAGIEQMHNKQLLVSDYLDFDGTEHHNAVWASTGNVDIHRSTTQTPRKDKDWANTGITISNHELVYNCNLKYFDIVFRNDVNRDGFTKEVLEQHENGFYLDGGLNYVDDAFECYFTPFPQTNSTLYDVMYNPYAKYIERMNECQDTISLHLNMYHMGVITNDSASRLILTRICDAFENNTNEDNFFAYKQYKGITTDFENSAMVNRMKQIGKCETNVMTHKKDALFYFGDTDEYICITGSLNVHHGEMFGKSNNCIVIKERGDKHPVYDRLVKAFYETTKDAGLLVV